VIAGGKLCFYDRPTGTVLPGESGSPEFMAAYHTAKGLDGVAAVPELTVVKKTPRPRTDAESSYD
jgi:hypothetical protein